MPTCPTFFYDLQQIVLDIPCGQGFGHRTDQSEAWFLSVSALPIVYLFLCFRNPSSSPPGSVLGFELTGRKRRLRWTDYVVGTWLVVERLNKVEKHDGA